jgi:Restriction endonuclease
MPFGKQFSPEQIALPKVLELAHVAAGDCKALEASLLKEYFAERPTSEEKLAMNTRIAMQQYGLLDNECNPTDVGQALYERRDDPPGLHREFARHILLNLHGAQMVQAIQVLSSQGLPLKAETIAEQLAVMGVEAGGRSGEKLNPIRLWLERAGVFRGRWELDETVFQQILGLDTSTLDALSGLTPEQRAFAMALAGLSDPTGTHLSSEVARLAEQQSTVRFDTKQVPKKVLFPLAEAGLITVTKTTAGRGAKPYVISGTEKMTAEVVGPLLENLEKTASPIDPRSLRRPIPELLAEVRDDSLSTDRRGKALEGVALQLTRALGVRFVAWRKRAHETGGAEVDLIASQANGRFAVWQIQCKVGSIRSRDVIDREVGVAQSLKSNIILFVTAGAVGKAARDAAETHMRATGLNIIFLDGADLDTVATGRSSAQSVDREFAWVAKIRGRA